VVSRCRILGEDVLRQGERAVRQMIEIVDRVSKSRNLRVGAAPEEPVVSRVRSPFSREARWTTGYGGVPSERGVGSPSRGWMKIQGSAQASVSYGAFHLSG